MNTSENPTAQAGVTSPPNCAVVPGSALGVTPFKGYDRSRDYLDVLVALRKKHWHAECNGVRRKYARAEVTDQECAALMVAADAFGEYLDRTVSCTEVKLEKETLWEYVASVAKKSSQNNQLRNGDEIAASKTL